MSTAKSDKKRKPLRSRPTLRLKKAKPASRKKPSPRKKVALKSSPNKRSRSLNSSVKVRVIKKQPALKVNQPPASSAFSPAPKTKLLPIILKKSLMRLTVFYLIIALNWLGVSAVGRAFAYFLDEELGEQNTLIAGVVDFSLFSENNFEPKIRPLEPSYRTISIINSNNPVQYNITAANFTGDICNYLNLQAILDNQTLYDGSLLDFTLAEPVELLDPQHDWEFIATVNTEPADPGDRLCQFDFIYQGWQLNSPGPENGFMDEETIDNLIEAPCDDTVKIKVNFLPGLAGVNNYGQGDMARQIFVGDGSQSYNEDEWITLYQNGQYLIDEYFYPDQPGLAIQRGHGWIKVVLYGHHQHPYPTDWEKAYGQIDFHNAYITTMHNDFEGGPAEQQGDGLYNDFPWQDEYFGHGDRSDFYFTVDVHQDGYYIYYDINNRCPVVEPYDTNIVINEVYYDVDPEHGQESAAQTDEWVELYNNTDQDIDLKDWTITDNSAERTVSHRTVYLPAHGYAVLAKAAQTWTYWDIPETAVKIELGQRIGNGLNNEGDRVILKDADGNMVDMMSYGIDNYAFNPTCPDVAEGHSLARYPAGYDTDLASDWHELFTPNPGTNPHSGGLIPIFPEGPEGLQLGEPLLNNLTEEPDPISPEPPVGQENPEEITEPELSEEEELIIVDETSTANEEDEDLTAEEKPVIKEEAIITEEVQEDNSDNNPEPVLTDPPIIIDNEEEVIMPPPTPEPEVE